MSIKDHARQDIEPNRQLALEFGSTNMTISRSDMRTWRGSRRFSEHDLAGNVFFPACDQLKTIVSENNGVAGFTSLRKLGMSVMDIGLVIKRQT